MKKTIIVMLLLLVTTVFEQQGFYYRSLQKSIAAGQSLSLEELQKKYLIPNIDSLDIHDAKVAAQILKDDNDITLRLHSLRYQRYNPSIGSSLESLSKKAEIDQEIHAYEQVQKALRSKFDIFELKKQYPDVAKDLPQPPAMS